MPDTQVPCPGGCGCKVPQSAIDAVIAKRPPVPEEQEVDEEPLLSWRELAISYHMQDSHAVRFNDCMTEPCPSARNAINHVTGLLTRARIVGVAEGEGGK